MDDNKVSFTGLNEADIRGLRKQYGFNSVTAVRKHHLFHIIAGIVREPMFIMLILACTFYFILGETNEGILMLLAMVFVSAISVYQEVKSNKALEALRKYTETKVSVIRDDALKVILSEELLPGDVILLEEGKRVPADAKIIQQNDLSIDASILTGESVPEQKQVDEIIYQGTVVNSGQCYAKVEFTGNDTALAKLGKTVSSMSGSKTLLQDQIGRFVKKMAFIGIIAFLLVWYFNYLHDKELIKSLLFGLTLAMSVLPEEIPVAFTSFMALGAYHMSKLGIITRQPQTIENLGAVSVICLDKTGTITENKMTVKAIYAFHEGSYEMSEDLQLKENRMLLYYARLASETDPFDAMEQAITREWQNTDAIAKDPLGPMIHEYPLQGQPPMMTHVYLDAGKKIVAAKGAPERILKVCSLKEEILQPLRELIVKMASSGYRVIAVSSATLKTGEAFPEAQDDFNWQFEGLLALYDPPKQNVHTQFSTWYRAGIDIKMITGDFSETANNIATQVGIKHLNKPLTGEEVMQLPQEALQERVKQASVFARMFPDAKLKVIEALKANDEIVAMTGDGVNDGPALKSAHIGIAMGDRGTELAKEAADLVITDDNLEKISAAIQQGRRIYSNFKKAVRYIISIHIPIILTASLPLLLGWKFPNIFTPIHVIFLELIMGPTCSVFYEREPVEPGIMHNPPRKRTLNMFSGKELLISIVQGLFITMALLGIYYYFMTLGFQIEYVRTMVFTSLILANLWLSFENRSFEESLLKTIRYKNPLVPYLLLISAGFLLAILLLEPVRQLFKLQPISFVHFLLAVGISFISVIWFEGYKFLFRQKTT
ncbi:MAG TPA: cation-translocating P-type ATPase [Ferruginibacter sp.]|nr:cation-translocating P-type ATPase [Ferruginibacter sp.]